MVSNDKEYMKEYNKKYYQANKDKISEYNKKNPKTEEQKEYKKEYDKKYREANKERIKEQNAERSKKFRQTEKGKKNQRIKTWKFKGVICDDFNKLYNYYINCKFCEECNVELIEGCYGANKKCLDHDHTTGLFRNVLCNTCNGNRGRIDNNIVKLTRAEYRWKSQLKAFILS